MFSRRCLLKRTKPWAFFFLAMCLAGKFDLAVTVSMKSRGILSSRTTSGHGRTSETVRRFSLLGSWVFREAVSSEQCHFNHAASDHVFHLTYCRQLQEILADEPFMAYPFQDRKRFLPRVITGSTAFSKITMGEAGQCRWRGLHCRVIRNLCEVGSFVPLCLMCD